MVNSMGIANLTPPRLLFPSNRIKNFVIYSVLPKISGLGLQCNLGLMKQDEKLAVRGTPLVALVLTPRGNTAQVCIYYVTTDTTNTEMSAVQN